MRAGTIAKGLAGLAILLLYLAFLARDFATLQGPGDSAVGNAWATLAALAALWGLLLVLLVVDQVRAKGWRTRPAILLVPIAGIATLFATDYPNDLLCIWAIAALPLIVAAYLMFGWLPERRARLAGMAQVELLVVMTLVSTYPIERFVS